MKIPTKQEYIEAQKYIIYLETIFLSMTKQEEIIYNKSIEIVKTYLTNIK